MRCPQCPVTCALVPPRSPAPTSGPISSRLWCRDAELRNRGCSGARAGRKGGRNARLIWGHPRQEYLCQSLGCWWRGDRDEVRGRVAGVEPRAVSRAAGGGSVPTAPRMSTQCLCPPPPMAVQAGGLSAPLKPVAHKVTDPQCATDSHSDWAPTLRGAAWGRAHQPVLSLPGPGSRAQHHCTHHLQLLPLLLRPHQLQLLPRLHHQLAR